MPDTLSQLHEAIGAREAIARELEPTPGEWREILELVGDLTTRYLSEMDDRPAWNQGAANPVELREPIPQTPAKMEDLLTQFSRSVLPNGVNPTSGRFVGYVPGGGLPTAAV